MTTRREFMGRAWGLAALTLLGDRASGAPALTAAEGKLPAAFEVVLSELVAEALSEGGVDVAKSRWQKPGRGAATGSDMFAGRIDPRYFRFEVEALYRLARRPGREAYRRVADAQVNYMARAVDAARHPAWAVGNALEVLGVRHAWNPAPPQTAGDARAAARFVEAYRARAVKVTTLDGVTFRHFPCGYGIAEYKANDAGWTNDLSMFGSGLVHAYELTGDASVLDDAAGFAEYFVQPWRPNALGPDGYWRCGTWHERLGTWVIGPSHYSGFESTDLHADEAGWVFSTNTCIDFLTRLHRHRPDKRYLDRCADAAVWTFRQCQFADDGAVGMCGRDDKWLGTTGAAVTQAARIAPLLDPADARLQPLRDGGARAMGYLRTRAETSKVEDHGVEWVNRTSSTDPLVNVAMLWTMALVGWLDGEGLSAAPGTER